MEPANLAEQVADVIAAQEYDEQNWELEDFTHHDGLSVNDVSSNNITGGVAANRKKKKTTVWGNLIYVPLDPSERVISAFDRPTGKNVVNYMYGDLLPVFGLDRQDFLEKPLFEECKCIIRLPLKNTLAHIRSLGIPMTDPVTIC